MADDTKLQANRAAREAKKKAYLRGIFDRYAERFRAAGSKATPSVAREVHAAIDEVMERERKGSASSSEIRCGRGCRYCCSGPVEIWPHEAALLLEAAQVGGVQVDRARLERQSRYTAENWREQPVADRACVFLGAEGECRVYEARPNACRKLLVTTDPALCEAAKYPPESVVRWVSWEAEILESAALEVFGAVLMPKALIALLKGTP